MFRANLKLDFDPAIWSSHVEALVRTSFVKLENDWVRIASQVHPDYVNIVVFEACVPAEDIAFILNSDALPFDYVTKIRREINFIRFEKNRSVTLIRSRQCMSPLFFSLDHTGLAIDFDIFNLLNNRIDLDWAFVAKYIVQGPDMDTATFDNRVKAIHAGMSIEIDPSQTILQKISPPEPQLCEQFWNFCDLKQSILNCVSRSIQEPSSVGNILFELSGGMDSSFVTCVANRLIEHPETYGVQYSGAAGLQQMGRRQEFIERFSCNDDFLPVSKVLPFTNDTDKAQEDFVDHYSCIYHKAVTQGLLAKKQGQFSFLMTGLGGDELFSGTDLEALAGRNEERGITERLAAELLTQPDDRSAYVGSFYQNLEIQVYAKALPCLRENIYPLHPLASLDMVDIFSALPREAKKGKFFARSFMLERNVSLFYLFPPLRENFAFDFTENLRSFDFLNMLRNSILVKSGMLNFEKIARHYLFFMNEGTSAIPLVNFAYLYRINSILELYLKPGGHF